MINAELRQMWECAFEYNYVCIDWLPHINRQPTYFDATAVKCILKGYNAYLADHLQEFMEVETPKGVPVKAKINDRFTCYLNILGIAQISFLNKERETDGQKSE